MSLLDATGAVGTGLQRSMGSIQLAARETRDETERERALQSPEAQLNRAVNTAALEKFKKDQVKVPMEDLLKSNPYAPHMRDWAIATGQLTGNEKELSVGESREIFKNAVKDPKVFGAIIQKSYDHNYAKDQDYKVDIDNEQKNLQDLQNQAATAQGNEEKTRLDEKIKKSQEKLATLQKEREPFAKGREMDRQHLDQIEQLQAAQFREQLPAADKATYDAAVEDLKAKGISRPPTANEFEQKKQQIKVATQERDVTTEMKNFEAKNPGMAAKRGTPEYATAFDKAHKEELAAKTGGDIQDQAKTIGDAIMRGEQSPVISGFGMAKLAPSLKTYLAKQGYNLKNAELDFHATQKYLASLNSTQQTRMRQAVNTAYESLDKIDDLAKEWKGGKFPVLNKANLKLATNGAYGEKAQQIATNLQAQISDVTSELGNVYMGGNSPTDHALKLAGQNLSADWTESQLLSATKLARTNLAYRQNSMTSLGAAGLSTGPAEAPVAKKDASNNKIGRFTVEVE